MDDIASETMLETEESIAITDPEKSDIAMATPAIAWIERLLLLRTDSTAYLAKERTPTLHFTLARMAASAIPPLPRSEYG